MGNGLESCQRKIRNKPRFSAVAFFLEVVPLVSLSRLSFSGMI